MAKGKKQDIGDIIRDVMGALTKPKRSGRAAKLQRKIPKPPSVRSLRPRKPSTRSGPQPMPRRAGDKPFDREKAILPRRPRNPRKPTGPSTRQMPKRKPKAGPKRGAKY